MLHVGIKTCAPKAFSARPHALHLPELWKTHICGAEFPACRSTAGCSFPISLHCSKPPLCLTWGPHVLTDQQGWPGFPCAASRNCAAINSIRKRLWSLKLNVALLFWHFFVKIFLHFSDWTLTLELFASGGSPEFLSLHNSGAELQCSMRIVLLCSYRTGDGNPRQKRSSESVRDTCKCIVPCPAKQSCWYFLCSK